MIATKSSLVTVCICTYNRAASLRSTLLSLERMVPLENGGWELLLVDNNSQDETAAVAREFEGRLPLRYTFEGEQGLSHSRNRALRECRGETLLFTDDDVRVSPTWLSAYQAAFTAKPDSDYFGGRVVPHWLEERPHWLRDESLPLLSGLLLRYDLGDQIRVFTDEDPLPFGASMAIRRRLFARHGDFRTDLGPIGLVPGRGDDAEYLARARGAGSEGSYVGTATAYHETDPKRLTLGYLYRYGIEKGKAHAAMLPDSGATGTRTRQIWFLVRGVRQLVMGRGDRFRQCVINVGIQEGFRRAGEAD